ncbi:hypothetical protein AMATHDRAFT_77454 [Amanita thiersii Skay4041]|uniref:Tyrosine specific protein phosphatases domain-containing protein n=1 Tax=Amanita thiersii Skay4041 TaxID=703135 RepID=A0A2A9NGQ5_9AGAR|nr:hypothetical protein AMATHDRAFT_77454 [Amanita thiersii Skay4041]
MTACTISRRASIVPPLSAPELHRPIPNSYWATPSLLACEFPWDPREQYHPKMDAILRSGVTTFIDLTEPGELEPYDNLLGDRATLLGIDPSTIEYHCFPIRDRCLPESLQFVQRVMDVLDDNERRGRMTAIHCRGGVGRTGTLVCCWFVYSQIAKDGKEALAIVESLWKTVPKSKRFHQSPETGAQMEFVLGFGRA